VDRRTRKDLKSDKFAQEVKHGFEFLTEHKEESLRYGAIVLAVLLVAGGIYFYVRHQTTVREDALAQAMRIDNATVGNVPPQPGVLHYATAQEKDQARAKALVDVSVKYHGTLEGAMAEFYLASDAADKGNLAEAEKRYKDIADSAPSEYAALAKLSLAKVFEAEGRDADAEKILRDLMAHPAVTVSKEQAEIRLAMLIGRKNPDQARKMLEPLRTERTAVSRAAMQALGDLSAR
jgi:predicted negative regulator of RcsB-dependent stress response